MSKIRAYTGNPELAGSGQSPELPGLDLSNLGSPQGYIPDEGLIDAVNVALMLQQPLLLTGEPGTGKTQLANNLAWELGLGDPLMFETKSTSIAKDLFYTYDTLSRFQVAHDPSKDLNSRDFIRYKALGRAILFTLQREEAARVSDLPDDLNLPRRSVVVIDEIDKAPRDFPNDILNELEHLYFRIPELGGVVLKADSKLRPIVLMTSNSEKGLPDAFLRRCIFYHIPFPDEERLERIVLSRVSEIRAGGTAVLEGIIDFFDIMREERVNLRKKPGTAELLNWATALVGRGIDTSKSLREQEDIASRTLSTLHKHQEDQEVVQSEFKRWVHEK